MVDQVGRKRGGDDLKNGFTSVFMVEGTRFSGTWRRFVFFDDLA